MHKTLYHISLSLYYIAIIILSPFYTKAKQFINGRKKWKTKLNEINFSNSNWIWIHFSSFGEYQDGKYFVAKIKEESPNSKLLFTFHSPSGYEPIKNTHIADYICYMPIDFERNAKQFIEIVQPKLIVFYRNDIWFNYLRYANKNNIPVIHLSTLIDPVSGFLKFPQVWHYKKTFCCF